MIFTGAQLMVSRSIFTQTGTFGFGLTCTVDNTTGQYRFGLTGAQGSLEFQLQSGRIYYQNQFIHAYQSNTQFLLEAQFTSGHLNVIRDSSALEYGNRKVTGAFDTFYFTRANSGMNADFDLTVSGNNIPVYSITTNGYLTATGQASVTGYFVNSSSYPIRVFGSDIQASQNYTYSNLVYSIPVGGSGQFAYTGDWTTFDTSDPILTTFHTNFGDASVLFNILNVASYNRFVQITGPSDFSFNSTGILNRNLTYLNFSGGFAGADFPTILTFSLEYVSGSGISSGHSVSYLTTGYGNFLKSGLITGYSTTAGNVSTFAWATGAATGFFSGQGTGLASGINYTGSAWGTFTGKYVGLIYPGSGTLNINGPVVGVGINGLSLFPTGAPTYATGYIDFSSPTEIFIGSADDDFEFIMDPDTISTCDNSDPFEQGGTYNTSPLDLSAIVQCLSGFSAIGVNGIVRSPNPIIDFTATVAGSVGNFIILNDGFLIGGSDGVGPTGISVYPIGPYTGSLNFVITGSGDYVGPITGDAIIGIAKTFTGSWDLLTGVDSSSLISTNLGLSEITMSGSGSFPSNSQVAFQVTHNAIDNNQDAARLIISGAEVINPINVILIN